jgi:hypothetical protein
MKRLLPLAALPVALLAAACGGSSNDIVTTNDNNVVLNDLQANYASTNDGEVPADNGMAGNMAEPGNDMGATANGAMADGATTNAQ